MAKILIVDDDPSIRDSLELILQYEHHDLVQAADGREALAAVAAERPDLVLLDVVLPGLGGLEVLQRIRQEHPDVAVIMVSGHGDLPTAAEATRMGAFDFIDKPLERDRLLVSVRNALRHRRMRQEIAARYRIVGTSAALRRMLAQVDRVAPREATVLILGEHGTGKELVARRLHELSPRHDGPFVDVNCAAIPRELIESQLFGHVKGAFTGADRDRRGKFEQAHGGTLFLDEVGDMGLESQAKVLRVLEERKVERVGGTTSIPVDVRVVAATNKDLAAEVRAGRFREDLYYRLNVVPIHVPPLRERRADIPALVDYFLRDACLRNAVHPVPRFTSEALARLQEAPWPGNVRELRNFVERLVILAPAACYDERLVASFLHGGRETLLDLVETARTFEEFKARSEALFLRRRLERYGWNVKRTAAAVGMPRSNLYKKMERYGLRKPAGAVETGEGEKATGSD